MRLLPVLVTALATLALAADEGHKHVDQELIRLQPHQATWEPGETAVLQGELRPGYGWAFCAVTWPDGSVGYLRGAATEARAVSVEIPLEKGPGRYQVELIVTSAYGNQVAANLDLFAGVEAFVPEAPSREFDKETSPGQLARQLWDGLNRLRQSCGLPPLPWDPTLEPVAREHVRAMVRADRLAHILPEDGGSVADRAARTYGWDVRYGLPGSPPRRTKDGPVLVGDNLAVSSNATIAMFLLAESPGHRAALLNRYADAVAIGASRSERREGNTVRQGIYFCMAFVQANDVAVHAQLEEAREHHRAEQEPGGEHLTRARMQRDNGKIYQALKSYEEYLQEQQDSPHRELVERWVTRLTADLERQQVDPDRKSWVVWNGKLQSAANLLRNRRPDKARLRLEELLRACPLEDIRAEARTLLDSIGDE